jgi:polyferredoxin
MSKLTRRLRLMKSVVKKGHRYANLRLYTMSLSIALLFAIPLLHVTRFDAFTGEHFLLMKPVSGIMGFAGACAGILVVIIITMSTNLFGGRFYCGWGCPAAQISRFGEAVEMSYQTRRRRLRTYFEGGIFGAGFSLAFVLWWTSPKVFYQGSVKSAAIAYGSVLFLAALTYLHGRYWRWQFCRKACPIGLYYSVVSPDKAVGIVFEQELNTCIDCNACTAICPVQLEPRELELELDDIGGLAMNGLHGDNHCIRCGDCVAACELVLRDLDREMIPLHFGLGLKGTPVNPKQPRKETIHE